MNIFYSVMGFAAQQSDKLSRQRVNFIPLNWLLIVAGPLLGLSAVVGSNDSTHLIWAVPLLVVVCLCAALLLLSWFLRNIVFQKQKDAPAPDSAIGGVPFEGKLVFTGKLRLQEKVARRFLAMPAQLVTLENGALAFVSNIDASSRMYGVVTKVRSGTWLSIPREGTLQMENGLFYYGFAGCPALRLKYQEELDGSKATAILAFDSAAQCQAACVLLSTGEAPQTSINPAFSS